MHERDLKNTNLIRKFLTDDLKSISKKLEAASDQRESQQAQVAEAERQAAVYGLDDTRTLQAFDSLSLALAGLKKDAEALELDLANRSKALEKKVNELRRITENKSRMVKTLTDEHRIIQEQILGIKKRESEKELSLINQIAIREKKKIALMTGDTRILSEDTLPLRETDFSNHETDAWSNVKATHTPKTLETLNRT
jgi:tRNA splicing endonuclease